jgi:hypothetical protein
MHQMFKKLEIVTGCSGERSEVKGPVHYVTPVYLGSPVRRGARPKWEKGCGLRLKDAASFNDKQLTQVNHYYPGRGSVIASSVLFPCDL